MLTTSEEQWRNLSAFGKGLWYVDEVEARWQTIIVPSSTPNGGGNGLAKGRQSNCKIPQNNNSSGSGSAANRHAHRKGSGTAASVATAEISWSKSNSSSFAEMHEALARLLGVEVSARNVHAQDHVQGDEELERSDAFRARASREEDAYQKVMAYPAKTLAMLSKANF